MPGHEIRLDNLGEFPFFGLTLGSFLVILLGAALGFLGGRSSTGCTHCDGTFVLAALTPGGVFVLDILVPIVMGPETVGAFRLPAGESSWTPVGKFVVIMCPSTLSTDQRIRTRVFEM